MTFISTFVTTTATKYPIRSLMTLLDPASTNDPNFQGTSPATQAASLTLTFSAGTSE